MDYLWTPWRFQYLESGLGKDECVFCRILQESPDQDSAHFVLAHGPHTFLILNRFPYTSGHLMVVLRRHVAKLIDAESAELEEVIQWARRCEEVLREVYAPEGFNIGFNVGSCAGAGVAGHLHLHVVPRWTGDANLVSVIGQTRTIPEELETTYEKLRPHLQNR
ncbi:MAG: HIT domain-containing protein [Acidobacteriota bacterium]|jgi:ATP adenylyltransferase